MSAYDYCASGTHEDDAITYDRLKKILEIAGVAGKFDETALFKGENANVRHHVVGFHEVRLDVLCAGLERRV